MMTVLEVLSAAADYLQKNGVESPRLNAEHLLAHSLGKRRLDLYLEFDRPLGERERAPMRELVRKRATGVPLQHLMGSTGFYGREFLCDARALIPRPETEQLVEWVISENAENPGPFLDIGTGSGVIAVTLALAHPHAQVHATDLSEGALELARLNAEKNEAAIHFSLADLFPSAPERFAVIAANLPYIPGQDISALSREVHHDPVEALDGGPDGLRIIAHLVENAPARMSQGGLLYLEVGQDQAAPVCGLLERENFRNIRTRADYQGVDRFVAASIG